MGPDLENVSPLVTYGLAGLAGLVVLSKLTQKSPLDALPSVGSDGFFGSLTGGLKYMTNASDIIREGYVQHKGKPFKVAVLYRWQVIVSGQKLADEVRKAPDDELSFLEATNDSLKTEYTLGHEIHNNPYHIPIIRSQLTRNLSALFHDIRDEIVTAFEETLQLKGNEWSAVPAMDAVMQIVCRTSNRLFVGLPLCRDPDWRALNIQFTIDVVKGGAVINLFPRFMSPLVAKYMTTVPTSIKRGMKHLQPIIEERQRYLDEYGTEWADKPNDMLSWLMDEAVGEERSVRNLTQRILTVNFAAIHTSSNSFTQALFNLAANPQYIKPLREEVEAIIEKEGWSKGAMVKMRKVDSFLRETQRFEGIGCLSMGRKALKDVTLSDGTIIPKGTIVAIASHATHRDEAVYDNAEVFEPFRFADLREEEGEAVKHQMVSTSLEYLPFGHGRHACPGRFFAANELKAMLAHVVLAYDVKLENDGPKPQNLNFGSAFAANTKAKVMFRKRQD
ncbi:cytochrome P450 [Hygrophoropsis aurantiaca]|uniref:Cytochrome P450 n=1 Tax=Hygrophoropsis aurantiaca TaxID=72124 RepID=A0ACB8A4N6_9AGAM|nr:cytochrome P450 [Hygrophoropsis aurantiaca]